MNANRRWTNASRRMILVLTRGRINVVLVTVMKVSGLSNLILMKTTAPDDTCYKQPSGQCPPMPSSNVPALCMPAWLTCPPRITVPPYPAPAGVEIRPISEGGRNSKVRFIKQYTLNMQAKSNYDYVNSVKEASVVNAVWIGRLQVLRRYLQTVPW